MLLRAGIVAVATKLGVKLKFLRSDSLDQFLRFSVDAAKQWLFGSRVPKEVPEIRDLDHMFARFSLGTTNPAVHVILNPNEFSW